MPELTEEGWEEVTEVCFQDIISTADQYIQFKFIHHLHYTSAKLNRMGLGTNAACPRCNLNNADLFHMFWSCLGLASYWMDLFNFFDNQLALLVPQTPDVGLLGILNDFKHRVPAWILIRTVLFYARKVIRLHWKDSNPPTVQSLFRIINGELPKFKIIYKSRACSKKCIKVLQTWMDVPNSYWGTVLSSQLN